MEYLHEKCTEVSVAVIVSKKDTDRKCTKYILIRKYNTLSGKPCLEEKNVLK